MSDRQDLFRLVYVSRSAGFGDPGRLDAEIADILEVSRRNNRRDEITGALLFSEDQFAQVLEGDMEAVMEAFERIQCDPRHRNTVILTNEPAAAREFGDWSMAYAGRVDRASLPVDLSGDAPAAFERSRAADAILTLLRRVVQRAVTA